MADIPDSTDRNVAKVGVSQPNKKKYEEDLQLLSEALKEKETLLKSQNVRPEEKVQQELASLLQDKESQGQRRQSADSELRRVSQEISKQETELTRIQSKLIYKDEAKVNNTIRRLENELTTRNFHLKEERKIVAEIDSLKRSKKDLFAFQALKKQIEEKRDQQRKLRDDRDRSYKEEKRLQQRQVSVRQEDARSRQQSEVLRSEITELRNKIRTLQSEFSAQEREYAATQREMRRHTMQSQRDRFQQMRERAASVSTNESKKVSSEETKATLSLAEYRGIEGPHDDDMARCSMLLKYLQRFLIQMGGPDESVGGATADVTGANQALRGDFQSGVEAAGKSLGGAMSIETDEEVAVLERSLEAEGLHMLKRKPSGSDMDILPSCRNSRASRRKKKSQPKKTLSHAPEIFAQFSKLGLEPPVSSTDVATSIDELQSKMREYKLKMLDTSAIHSLSTACGMTSQGQVHTAASFCSDLESRDESAVSGVNSCPVTPEGFTWGLPPLMYLDEQHRVRLSPDSGTGELDEAPQQDSESSKGSCPPRSANLDGECNPDCDDKSREEISLEKLEDQSTIKTRDIDVSEGCSQNKSSEDCDLMTVNCSPCPCPDSSGASVTCGLINESENQVNCKTVGVVKNSSDISTEGICEQQLGNVAVKDSLDSEQGSILQDVPRMTSSNQESDNQVVDKICVDSEGSRLESFSGGKQEFTRQDVESDGKEWKNPGTCALKLPDTGSQVEVSEVTAEALSLSNREVNQNETKLSSKDRNTNCESTSHSKLRTALDCDSTGNASESSNAADSNITGLLIECGIRCDTENSNDSTDSRPADEQPRHVISTSISSCNSNFSNSSANSSSGSCNNFSSSSRMNICTNTVAVAEEEEEKSLCSGPVDYIPSSCDSAHATGLGKHDEMCDESVSQVAVVP